jgi:hypothetical protein
MQDAGGPEPRTTIQGLDKQERAPIWLEMRELLFTEWCASVRKLAPVNVAAIRERYPSEKN